MDELGEIKKNPPIAKFKGEKREEIPKASPLEQEDQKRKEKRDVVGTTHLPMWKRK